MRIVVIQRHEGNLSGIKENVARINGERAKEIIYTSNPEEVVKIVRDGIPTFIVSGQIFDHVLCGTDLASIVKQVNPQVLFFIYSTMPEANEAVDGVIPKKNGTFVTRDHKLLARILASDLDTATPESIKAAFPEVEIFLRTMH